MAFIQWRPVYYDRFGRTTKSKIGYQDYLMTDVWDSLRHRRMAIDHYRCVICGSGINLEVHHTHYPAVWGREDVWNHLITVCDNCHKTIHTKDLIEEEEQYGTDS